MVETRNAIETLKASLERKVKDEIQSNIELLNNTSRPFAERVMDIAIATAMKGKKI